MVWKTTHNGFEKVVEVHLKNKTIDNRVNGKNVNKIEKYSLKPKTIESQFDNLCVDQKKLSIRSMDPTHMLVDISQIVKYLVNIITI